MWFPGRVTDDERARSAPRRRTSAASWVIATVLAVAALGVSWLGMDRILNGAPPAADGGPIAAPGQTEEPAPTPTVNIDIATPSSPSVLVGPRFPLAPVDYAPADLVQLESISLPASPGAALEHDAAYALLQLFADARYEQGLALSVDRGYVSAADQAAEYDAAVASSGQEAADREVGSPAHNEHQTGYAADIALEGDACSLQACFADTDAGQWLAEHATDYGFIVRYPNGSSAQTGVADAPYQLRYVGDELAAQIRASGAATYEEFLGLPPAG